ncbi:Uncharacterised protein [Pseudomonas fluorescens]|uniref:Uncharacterized protein n=1 Tax=Pseudomonas fluorescens TaxID=294 RepID=A0A448DVP9_PSEFL|nr:hypothetical protein [Pseudomonas fluorescens]VEF10840.1 Uncharacterised protein [Pseudomonas fluorescens]
MISRSKMTVWMFEREESVRIDKLFIEAERLDNLAYRLFHDKAAWDICLEAQALADAQRTEAYQAWMEMRRHAKEKSRRKYLN